MNFALEALTGKSMDMFIAESKKALETGRKSAKAQEKGKKKDSAHPIMARLRHFLSGGVD